MNIRINEPLIEYYRKKFFPHLMPHYGRLCVIAVLMAAKGGAS